MESSYPKKVKIFLAFGLIVTLLNLATLGSLSSVEAADTVALPIQAVAPGDATLTVSLELPAGCKLNMEAPSTFSLKSTDINIVAVDEKYAQNLPVVNLPLSLTVPVKEGKTTLQTTFRLNFCDEKLGLCYFKEAVLNLPVEVNKNSANKKLEIIYKVPAT